MRKGITMYQLGRYDVEQNNIAIELSAKSNIDVSIHWLNPLFIKCRY
jgi:hypothetical protein